MLTNFDKFIDYLEIDRKTVDFFYKFVIIYETGRV